MAEMFRALARSSFVLGMARSLDLVGAFNQPSPYRRGEDGVQVDAAAIANDWGMVGQDIATAAEILGQEEEREAVVGA